MTKKSKSYLFTILFLFLISFFLTIDNFHLQSAIDGALIINGDLKFPNQSSNVLAVHYNSWTILNHISLLLVKTNLNVFIIHSVEVNILGITRVIFINYNFKTNTLTIFINNI